MLTFNGTVGSLFARLGKIAAVAKNLRSTQVTQQTAMTDPTTGVEGQYNSEPDLQAIMGAAYIGILNGMGGGIGGTCRTLAAATVNRQVFRDNPQPGQTLTQGNILTSLQEVIRQMQVEGATVLAMTVTASPGTFIGTGTPIINAAVRRPLDGRVLENSFTENILVVCQADSYSGGALPFNESFSVQGTGAQTDTFAFNWPLGSGSNAQVNAIDGNTDNGSGNLLINSSFGDTGSSVLSNWTIVVGTVGTNYFAEASIVLRGTSALRILGDGSTKLQWLQTFGLGSAGTPTQLSPNTQYSFNVFLRRDGIAAGAGIMQIALVDQNNNIINDQLGTPNSVSIDLTQLNTVYTAFNFDVRTPTVMSAQQSIQFLLTTPYTTGRSFYVDCASLGNMTQVYTSGPFMAIHSGAIASVDADYADIAVVNSRGAGGTLSSWQPVFQQLFYGTIMSNELILPSSLVPTLPDSLIA